MKTPSPDVRDEAAPARILIVEDEAIVAADLADRLGQLGYVVNATVATGEEAVEQAAREPVDLVIMDIHLAGAMSGTRAAAEIRRRVGVPVVFLTAHSAGSIIQEAKDAAPYGYILKPFDLRELTINIQMALERRRLEVERERMVHDLQHAYASVRRLRGLLPICSSCHRVRDDQGYWASVESYIEEHADIQFSHGLCPSCLHRLYPDQDLADERGDGAPPAQPPGV